MRNLNASFPKKWQAMPTNISKNLSLRRLGKSNFKAESGAWKYGHCQKIGNFHKDLLFKKTKTNEKNLENVFEKLQDKTRDSKVAEIYRRRKKKEEVEALPISVNELFFYVEQILLLEQSRNAITYHIRLNVLGYIMNLQYQVKIMLKEKAVLLQKHDRELFGKKFMKHIDDTINSKRETREIFADSKNPFP